MKSHCLPLFAALFTSALLSTTQSKAASTPSWTCEIPVSTFQSTSSSLSSANSDAAGNTFVVIAHQGTMDAGGIPVPTQLGLQIALISTKGKIVASADLPATASLVPLQITGKKVLAFTPGSSTVTQLTVGPNATFVSTPLTFQAAGEIPSFAGAPGIERKYVFTTISTANKITTLKRYSLSKLKP